jgi:hypothetical protein
LSIQKISIYCLSKDKIGRCEVIFLLLFLFQDNNNKNNKENIVLPLFLFVIMFSFLFIHQYMVFSWEYILKTNSFFFFFLYINPDIFIYVSTFYSRNKIQKNSIIIIRMLTYLIIRLDNSQIQIRKKTAFLSYLVRESHFMYM